MSETKTTSGWPYLLCGVTIGAAMGILFAPKPGKETREDVSDWIKAKREESREFFDEVREKLPAKKSQIVSMWKAGKEKYGHRTHKREPLEA